MKVYWTPFIADDDRNTDNFKWIISIFPEPENAYKNIVKNRNKETEFLRCPAVQEYFKNTFLIRAPMDLTISVNEDGLRTYEYDQQYFDYFVHRKTVTQDAHESLVIAWDYVFYSDESCIIEVLPAFMETTDIQKTTRVIPGTFDISKWIRNVEISFEIVDKSKDIVIKKGDPLYYVKFIPKDGSKIVLERTNDMSYVQSAVEPLVSIKRVIKNNSLKENYDMAKSFLSAWRKGRPKTSKCPLHFWK